MSVVRFEKCGVYVEKCKVHIKNVGCDGIMRKEVGCIKIIFN